MNKHMLASDLRRMAKIVRGGFQKNKQDPTTTADAFESGLDGWLKGLKISSVRNSSNGEYAIILTGEKDFTVGSHDISITASAFLCEANGPTDEDLKYDEDVKKKDDRKSICLNLHATTGADWGDDYRVVVPISQVNGVKVEYHQYKTTRGYNAIFVKFEPQEEQKETDLLMQLVSMLTAEWNELMNSDKVGSVIYKDVIEHIK